MTLGKGVRVAFAILMGLSIVIIIWTGITLVANGSALGSEDTLVPVTFEDGEASVDGGDWIPLSDASFDASSIHTVQVRGHLSQTVPSGSRLNIRLDNVDYRFSVNHSVVYTFGFNPTVLSRSAGNTWGGFASNDWIGPDDEVEVTMSNVYVGINSSIFDLALDRMVIGSSDALVVRQFSHNWFHLLFGLAASGAGFFLLALALLGTRAGWASDEGSVWFSLFAISTGCWALFDPEYIDLLIAAPTFTNYMCSTSAFTMIVFLCAFVASRLKGKSHDLVGAACVVDAVAFFVISVLQLTGGKTGPDYFDFTNPGIVMGSVTFVFGTVMMIRDYFLMRDVSLRTTVMLYLPCAVGVSLEYIEFFVNHAGSGFFIEAGVTATIILRGPEMMAHQREKSQAENRLIQLEAELRESQMSIMLSQIQPHFLYNALNTIQYLCRTDPETAADAVGDFAAYLRGNMDSLKQMRPIPFELVLNHLEHYLAIERLRFPDVSITYDLKETNFRLPVLSVQALVENAIRYGVGKKAGGGSIVISTWKDDAGYHVSIVDDGVGFDTSAPLDGSRSHIGIENTRERLATMCGGILEIDSEPGVGTSAVITVPLEEGMQ